MRSQPGQNGTEYLGPAEQIRDRGRLGMEPTAVSTLGFRWPTAILSISERLNLVAAVDRIVPKDRLQYGLRRIGHVHAGSGKPM